jgi:hydrogen cyanide synthase HcnC
LRSGVSCVSTGSWCPDNATLALSPDKRTEFDVALIGGGLVGMPVAWSLARQGLSVVVLDEGDVAVRPSRGNFALVWVQGKGYGLPAYAAWSQASARGWPNFSRDLREDTGIDVGYQNPGGLMIALCEDELDALRRQLQRLMQQPGMAAYAYEVLDRPALQRLLPDIGPEVVGATYCALDGHVNSLRLFHALHRAAQARGAVYRPAQPVLFIRRENGGGFRINTATDEFSAGKVVLAAGHGNARLAPMVGLNAPVRPQRGQILVTEKLAPFLPLPLSQMRQTDEGGVMIGDSLEEVGFDASVGLGVLSVMAERAVRTFPLLADVNVVRSWAALRVMTPDGFPIYDHSAAAPGAFVLTCHSGVTLAAAHAERLAPAIANGRLDADLAAFSAGRFNVPQAG